MKIIKKDASLIFNDTKISDLFITKYLPDAPGDAVKIYIYLLFQTKFSDDITIKSISNSLNIGYTAVKAGLEYWEQKGILVKNSNGYILRNLKEVELFEKYNPKIELSKEEIEKKNKENAKANVIDDINKLFFQGVMSPTWVATIYNWYEKYLFTDEVMLALFQYGKDKNALNKNYLEQVARGWNSDNIKTYEDLNNYLSVKQVIYKCGKQISNTLRLYRALTEFEEECLKRWLFEYNFKEEIIDIAVNIASEKGTQSFKYIDAILNDWNENNLKTKKDIIKYIETKKNENKTNKDIKTNNGVNKKVNVKNPHDQRKFTDLDNLYD